MSVVIALWSDVQGCHHCITISVQLYPSEKNLILTIAYSQTKAAPVTLLPVEAAVAPFAIVVPDC